MPNLSRLRLALASLSLLALPMLGCDTEPSKMDGGGAMDTGAVADAGVRMDAQPRPDAAADAAAPDAAAPDAAPAPDADVDAGPPPVDAGPVDGGFVVSTRPRNGSAVAITADDRVGLFVNRRTGKDGFSSAALVESYMLDVSASPPTATAIGSHALDNVYQIIIGNDDDSAFAAGRTEVVKFTGIKGGSLTRSAGVTVGAESRGIALSPTGSLLFIANWSDGTVAVVRTQDMSLKSTIDLNAALASSGLLGDSVSARPALAHPFAVTVTNDGDMDDSDETVYVTEFFSQARLTGVPTDDSGFDLGRQGVVYRFDVGSETVAPLITLAPIADTGFVDSNGNATGCFPNQLNAATISGGILFVTGVCASPRGPVGPILDATTGAPTNTANFKTQVHATIFKIDLATNLELGGGGDLLTRQFQALYDANSVADDGTNRRIPLIPNDIAFVPSTGIAYVSAYGSDAVFRVQYNNDGTINAVGSSTQRFINLVPQGQSAGRLPLGIGIAGQGTVGVVVNEFTRNVSFIALATQNVVGTANLTDPSPTGAEADINTGRRFFVTGLGRWSFRGQAWNSCEACHPDGLTDNVTWFFARGPRQTTSLDGSYNSADPNQRRVFNWTAVFDETHDFELNTRGNSGGVGAIVHTNNNPATTADRIHFDGTTPVPAGAVPTATPQAGLNGSTISLMPSGPGPIMSVLDDWDKITAYVRSIPSPRAPSNLSQTDVAAGRQLFVDNNCAGCHGTEMWTISRVFYTPNESNNNPTTGLLRTTNYTADAAFPSALNPPTSASGRSAPLRFNGTNPGANDQINCILRAVGTFPATLDASQTGIAPLGVRIREARQDMTTNAQGSTGFNPPSLLGMVTGAPYFHAGNARTLEEVFVAPTFDAHSTAFSSNFPGAGDRATLVRQLVAFLLSVDEGTAAVSVPTTLGFGAQLCPASFP